ncbi:hypothetical protein N789_09610 [Arenimonas oryziterrae DSM 21050 = YC6267]|uniref:Uncharacterized protein n=1 Tax=Arenimonas oryziterrae DSM 21050 = YC6267 TaxID=1121015 RepID=A0A091AVS5_9GAMM|nr:hypothetical protein N789_09610 [Arenimonas oryziterrae DSM 21050 = YC6267]
MRASGSPRRDARIRRRELFACKESGKNPRFFFIAGKFAAPTGDADATIDPIPVIAAPAPPGK